MRRFKWMKVTSAVCTLYAIGFSGAATAQEATIPVSYPAGALDQTVAIGTKKVIFALTETEGAKFIDQEDRPVACPPSAADCTKATLTSSVQFTSDVVPADTTKCTTYIFVMKRTDNSGGVERQTCLKLAEK